MKTAKSFEDLKDLINNKSSEDEEISKVEETESLQKNETEDVEVNEDEESTKLSK